MNTRKTHDYSPILPGSKEEQQAINARREMLNIFSRQEVKKEPRRKTWLERMHLRTVKAGKPMGHTLERPYTVPHHRRAVV